MEPTDLAQEKWQLLVSFLNASNSAIVVTKGEIHDYQIIFVNPAFEKLTGFNSDEVIGRNCRFLQNEDRNQPVLARIRKCLRSGGSCVCFVRNYRKSGQAFWNRITIFPLMLGDNTENFVSIQQDASSEFALVDSLKKKSRDRKRLIQDLQTKQVKLEQLSVDLINAQEAERQAVARELHDELGQRLTALVMKLDEIKSRLGPTDESNLLPQAEEDVKYLIRLVRNMNASLRPVALALSGLEEAIRELLRRQLSELTTWSFDFSYKGPPLPSVLEISLFRIVQECLTNIVRHSYASHVMVRVTDIRKGNEVKLTIVDDGLGFDSSDWHQVSARANKFGLIGIRERAELLRGSLNIQSGATQGTRVEVVIPVRRLTEI